MWAGDIGSPLIGGGLDAIRVAYLRLRTISYHRRATQIQRILQPRIGAPRGASLWVDKN
jgi:hypothetical protein